MTSPCYCLEGVMRGGETQAEPWVAWLRRQTELPATAKWGEHRRGELHGMVPEACGGWDP